MMTVLKIALLVIQVAIAAVRLYRVIKEKSKKIVPKKKNKNGN